jgi:hypothetical protein
LQLARSGDVATEDAEFAGGAADFSESLVEPGDFASFDVNEKLIFPRAAVNRAALNLEQIDAMLGEGL